MTVIEALQLLATILGGTMNAVRLVEEVKKSGRDTLTNDEVTQLHAHLSQVYGNPSGANYAN